MKFPLCPVTGEPAVRHVQWVKARFITDLWRYSLGVDARPSFGANEQFGLWESPTGLYFFDPMIEGDRQFYTQFYSGVMRRGLWSHDYVRREFELAAGSVNTGDRILDVGCGFAEFRSVIPEAEYTGLDPNFAPEGVVEGVNNQTLRDHLIEREAYYDVVCAFQVLEHLRSPVDMFADMVRAARPGGLLIVGVPHVPSALTRIPNHVMNAPPHHLSWWTRSALTALAKRQGATVCSIERIPWGARDALFYWMERCSPIRCSDVFYRNRISWHAAAIVGFLAGRLVHAVRKIPVTTDEGAGLLMIARRES